ncbi:PH domain-containing protein [Herbiconiux sp. SYSU D00978]|uniref:PH domain-containing protein n=1 Tax=Herbiconiux sp. SYSU D00978 TaxID=2812562 RepID=UPI0027DDA10A|nr:PH domain-containing protein [Herbiconiux sp. SYSU D00978]
MTETAVTRPTEIEWHGVSPKYIAVDLIGTAVSALIFTAAATVPYWLIQEPWALIPSAAVLLVHLVVLVLTPRRIRSIRYALRADDLLVRRGIMFTRLVAVPYGRMQLVDVNRGPIARAFGLSELKFVTAAASSNILLPGLPAEEADDLRDRLVALAESRRTGL